MVRKRPAGALHVLQQLLFSFSFIRWLHQPKSSLEFVNFYCLMKTSRLGKNRWVTDVTDYRGDDVGDADGILYLLYFVLLLFLLKLVLMNKYVNNVDGWFYENGCCCCCCGCWCWCWIMIQPRQITRKTAKYV